MGGGTVYPSYLSRYNNLVNTDSPLTIDLEFVKEGIDQFAIKADVELTSDISTSNNKILYILTYEKSDEYFAQVINYADENFTLNTSGETATFSHSFSIDSSLDVTKIKAIALVQTFSDNYLIHQGAITGFTGMMPLITSNVQVGPACLQVDFTSNSLPQGGIIGWEWDLDGDGSFDSTEENPSYLYETPGTYDVTLKIFDGTEYLATTWEDYITVFPTGTPFAEKISGIWKAEYNPYVIAGDVFLAAEDELIIEPGVEIQIGGNCAINVNGRFIADASEIEENPIIFSSNVNWKGININADTNEIIINNCKISKCTQSAIEINNSSNVTIIGNQLKNNTIAASGATISITSSENVIISKNLIINNTASKNTGGILCLDSNPIIKNNIIANNDGLFGSIVLKNGSNATMINNTIANNTATNSDIFIYSSSPVIMNSIIKSDNENIINVLNGTADITYSCISGGYEGIGNIDEDPLFINSMTDWHLQAGSPCIDAGNPDVEYNDLDESRNDMGAYGGEGGPVVDAEQNELMVNSPASTVQIYPNPFNPQTAISLQLSEMDKDKPVTICVYNIKGQLVKTLIHNKIIDNQINLTWNGKNNSGSTVASGLYLLKVDTVSQTTTAKMMLLK